MRWYILFHTKKRGVREDGIHRSSDHQTPPALSVSFYDKDDINSKRNHICMYTKQKETEDHMHGLVPSNRERDPNDMMMWQFETRKRTFAPLLSAQKRLP
jgi:hypothetical protein